MLLLGQPPFSPRGAGGGKTIFFIKVQNVHVFCGPCPKYFFVKKNVFEASEQGQDISSNGQKFESPKSQTFVRSNPGPQTFLANVLKF